MATLALDGTAHGASASAQGVSPFEFSYRFEGEGTPRPRSLQVTRREATLFSATIPARRGKPEGRRDHSEMAPCGGWSFIGDVSIWPAVIRPRRPATLF